jgi:branched-chain amino acid transport system substrate-binding protein
MSLEHRQHRTALALLLGAVLSFTGCSSENKGGAGSDGALNIGFLSDYGDTRSTQATAAQYLVLMRAINAAGGLEIDGVRRHLDLQSADDGSTPAGAARALTSLHEQGITTVLGPSWSSVTLGDLPDHSDGAAATARDLSMLLVSGSATAAAISTMDDHGLFFRTVPSDNVQAQVAAQTVYHNGARTAAVLYRSDAWGSGLNEAFVTNFQALGGQVVAQVSYAPDAIPALDNFDYSSKLAQIFSEAPDVIYIASFSEFLTIAHQLDQGGYFASYPSGSPQLFGTDGVYPNDLVSNAPASVLARLSGTVGSSDHSSADYALLARWMADGGLENADIDTARADALFLIALAIQAAGTTDAEAVKLKMTEVSRADPGDVEIHIGDWALAKETLLAGGTVNYEGVSGGIEFDDAGDRTEGVIQVWKSVETNGAWSIDAETLVPYPL